MGLHLVLSTDRPPTNNNLLGRVESREVDANLVPHCISARRRAASDRSRTCRDSVSLRPPCELLFIFSHLCHLSSDHHLHHIPYLLALRLPRDSAPSPATCHLPLSASNPQEYPSTSCVPSCSSAPHLPYNRLDAVSFSLDSGHLRLIPPLDDFLACR